MCGCAARVGMPFGRTTRGRACKIAMRAAKCAMVIGAGHRERGFRIRRARCADVSIGARPRLQQAAAHGMRDHAKLGRHLHAQALERNLHPFCKTSIQRIRQKSSKIIARKCRPRGRERVLPPRFLCTSLSMVSRRRLGQAHSPPLPTRGHLARIGEGGRRHARRLKAGRTAAADGPRAARARCSRR